MNKHYNPIKFYLDPSENETKTLGDVIVGTIEELVDNAIIPEYPCRRCKTGYSLSQFDYCETCIDEMVEED